MATHIPKNRKTGPPARGSRAFEFAFISLTVYIIPGKRVRFQNRKNKNMTINIKKYLAAAFLTGACALCPGRTPQGEMNSILASVNGTPVSLQDVLPLTRAEEFKAYSSSGGPTLQKRIADIRRKAVDEIIDRQLILEDYSEKKFEIAERDIESAIDELAERSGARSRSDFADKLRRQGGSIELVRKRVLETMIVQLMLHREFLSIRSITPEQMYDYYKKNILPREKNGSIELAMLLLDDTKQSLIGEIARKLQKDPALFPELAAKYSSGPGKEDGGRLGKISCDLLRPEFSKALKSPRVGAVYGPLKTPEGTVFLKVLDLTAGTPKSFKASLPEIRKKLEAEQRQKSRLIYTQRLRKKAVIRYFF